MKITGNGDGKVADLFDVIGPRLMLLGHIDGGIEPDSVQQVWEGLWEMISKYERVTNDFYFEGLFDEIRFSGIGQIWSYNHRMVAVIEASTVW